MLRSNLGILPATLGIVLSASRILAQAPINAESATQPAKGHFNIREQFRYYELDDDPSPQDRDIRELTALTWIEYGLRGDMSVSLRVPLSYRWEDRRGVSGTDEDFGLSDVTALFKWRFFKKDSGPINTARWSLLAGAEIRSGDSEFSSDAYNPILGTAYTQVMGRHGINLAGQWEFTTSGVSDPRYVGDTTADVFRYDAAYLFRLLPAKYEIDTHGALYGLIEANGTYETNGDNELLLSPGLMYEARTWTLELSFQLPILQEVDHRPEVEYAVVVGLRLLL